MGKIKSRAQLVSLLTEEGWMTAADANEVADVLEDAGCPRIAKFTVLAGKLRIPPKRCAALLKEVEEYVGRDPMAFDAKAAAEVNDLAKRAALALGPEQAKIVSSVLKANMELLQAEMEMLKVARGVNATPEDPTAITKGGPLAKAFNEVQARRKALTLATQLWHRAGCPGMVG
jgi:hypothetical protein